ncbi:O-antigen ligase family protein [Bradyrhizobium arachidis]|uniref:O-antigen ligase family protein n=1 Tax=Bradyrhizobium arachidis TaxID=858423 RepID=UPI002163BD88|nr:O-antigen ligase family protein [Bradyrhizobium arachidis]UVO30208.1 hypothetical protein KUF59_05445 [Bradyrhizobium arachidis]
MLGILVSAGSLAVLAHGLLGAGSVVTGLLFAGPVALLVVLGEWRAVSLNLCDGLFIAFVASVGLSLLVNGHGSDLKELALLAITLWCYLAGRLSGEGEIRRALMIAGSAVTAAGALATLVALIEQWSAPHGKPMVFGQFDAAPAQFSMLMGLCLLAWLTSLSRTSGLIVLGVLAAVPAAIFVASMVRFSFAALALALFVAVVLGPRMWNRRGVAVLAAMAFCTIVVALALRWQTTRIFVDHAFNAAAAPWSIACEAVDRDNSIAIRGQLFRDALRLLPAVGPFGIGLDGFEVRGCIKGIGVHNVFLQASIEFGWLAGLALLTLVVSAWRGVRTLAPIVPDYRFVAAALVYVATISLMHGRISREFALFLLLGYAARLWGEAREAAAKWMPRTA